MNNIKKLNDIDATSAMTDTRFTVNGNGVQKTRSVPCPVLFWLAVFLTAMLLPLVWFYWTDSREIYDVNLWLKPIKFNVSLSVYALTLCAMCALIPKRVQQQRWFVYLLLLSDNSTPVKG